MFFLALLKHCCLKPCHPQVLLFIPDKIAEHNHRAVGSKNPEKSARVKANRLRNKCKEAIQSSGLSEASYSYVKWMEEVETCRKYEDALKDIKHLYQVNDEFRAETRDATEAALLRRLKNSRENGGGNKDNGASESTPDLEEGVNYLLKELAFFVAVPNIYENCEEFVVVYHRSWPVLEKFFSGCYDGVVRPCLGFVVFE